MTTMTQGDRNTFEQARKDLHGGIFEGKARTTVANLLGAYDRHAAHERELAATLEDGQADPEALASALSAARSRVEELEGEVRSASNLVYELKAVRDTLQGKLEAQAAEKSKRFQDLQEAHTKAAGAAAQAERIAQDLQVELTTTRKALVAAATPADGEPLPEGFLTENIDMTLSRAREALAAAFAPSVNEETPPTGGGEAVDNSPSETTPAT